MSQEKTTERVLLEEEAKSLNVRFNPKISSEKLQARIADKKNGVPDAVPKSKPAEPKDSKYDNVDFSGPSPEDISNARVGNNDLPETSAQRRMRLYKDAARLVRVRVTCMNPNKRDYRGEFIAAGNGLIGIFRKFVQFGVPYHVPYIIYQYMRDKQYQMFVTVQDKYGNDIRKGQLVNEFAIEVLPMLTEEERKALATEQARTGRIEK